MAIEPAASRTSPFQDKPMLVFWETTRACLLACRHCRAEAQRDPLPGELTTTEAERLLRDVRAFGDPPPVLVMTGGDLLMRRDIFDLIGYARSIGLHVAAAPAATPLLTQEAVERLAASGASAISLSIDAVGAAHDAIRGVQGTFEHTIRAARWALGAGLRVQVNSVVMQRTLRQLPGLAQLLLDEGIPIWEVFYLIATGRGPQEASITPEEYRDVSRFLLDVTRYGLLVRTVEGPLIRRVAGELEEPSGALYRELRLELAGRLGEPEGVVRMGKVGTLDGDGIVFVAHDGSVSPGGFLPIRLGDFRENALKNIYRDHPLLGAIRGRRLHGLCGECEYRDGCGGSRARAYAASGDPLGADPLCPDVALRLAAF